MAGAQGATIAAIVVVIVSASLPCYLYGAWIILRETVVSWKILRYHLIVIGIGLGLTTGPIILWMIPRFFSRFDGFTALHAFLGLQAYAMLVFALTGIVRILKAKLKHDLYHDPDPTIAIEDLGPNMDAWRFRLRVGVAGYVVFWLLAWIVGVIQFWLFYIQ